MKNNRLILRSALSLFIMSAFIKVLGYFEKIILAYYYGTGIEVDVFLLVTGIVLSVFIFFRELIEPGFLNVFLKIHHINNNKAWAFFNSYLKLLLLPVLLVTIGGMVFPEQLASFFAPGFTGEKKQLTIKLIRIAFPAVLFLSVSNLTAITLNGQKRFVLPVSGDLAYKAITILLFVLLVKTSGIAAAAIGLVVGAAIKLLIHLSGLLKKLTLKNTLVETTYYKDVWRLTWPLLIGMVLSQSNIVVDNIFASYMNSGTIAALAYAKKIVEMPVAIFPYILGIVVFPFFSQLAIEENKDELKKIFNNAIGWITFVFIPILLILYTFSKPIVSILLERGAFDAASTLLTARPMAIYSIGILSFAVETIIVLAFFALSDTKTPVFVGVICVILNIIITYLLIPYIGYLAIALALVISKTLKVCVLFGKLARRMQLDMNTSISFGTRMAFSGAILFAYLTVVRYGLIHIDPLAMRLNDKQVFLCCAITGIGVYVLACYCLGLKPWLQKSLN